MIEGHLIELLLIEGLVLNIINFESLIATKTARIKESGAKILAELGLRRAQGINGALSASKAAYIGEQISQAICLLDINTIYQLQEQWLIVG